MTIFGYVIFGIGIIGLLYIYFFYSILIWLWAYFFGKNIQKDISYKPEITIVIAAHNEESLIEKSIRSIFSSNYPLEKIEILIGSDGSDDSTFEICEKLSREYTNIKVYNFPRGGKNNTLNKLTPLVKTDIICFMDADIMVQSDTISIIMSNFADSEVGAVISAQIYTDSPDEINAGHQGEKTYQQYESMIKFYESRIYSTVNNIGPFYFVRKKLYRKLQNEKICDDLTAILDVNIAKKRVIYENETFVIEFRKKSLENELGRRIRVVSGGLESIVLAKELISLKHLRSGFFLISHKLSRYLSPFFIIFVVLGTLLNIGNSLFINIFLYVEILFSLAVISGYIFDKLKIHFTPFQFAIYFFTMNYGFFKGIMKFFAKKSSSTW